MQTASGHLTRALVPSTSFAQKRSLLVTLLLDHNFFNCSAKSVCTKIHERGRRRFRFLHYAKLGSSSRFGVAVAPFPCFRKDGHGHFSRFMRTSAICTHVSADVEIQEICGEKLNDLRKGPCAMGCRRAELTSDVLHMYKQKWNRQRMACSVVCKVRYGRL